MAGKRDDIQAKILADKRSSILAGALGGRAKPGKADLDALEALRKEDENFVQAVDTALNKAENSTDRKSSFFERIKASFSKAQESIYRAFINKMARIELAAKSEVNFNKDGKFRKEINKAKIGILGDERIEKAKGMLGEEDRAKADRARNVVTFINNVIGEQGAQEGNQAWFIKVCYRALVNTVAPKLYKVDEPIEEEVTIGQFISAPELGTDGSDGISITRGELEKRYGKSGLKPVGSQNKIGEVTNRASLKLAEILKVSMEQRLSQLVEKRQPPPVPSRNAAAASQFSSKKLPPIPPRPVSMVAKKHLELVDRVARAEEGYATLCKNYATSDKSSSIKNLDNIEKKLKEIADKMGDLYRYLEKFDPKKGAFNFAKVEEDIRQIELDIQSCPPPPVPRPSGVKGGR